MALENENGSIGTTMLVQPSGMYGGYNNGGLFGNDLSFLILFFLLCGGGWGMGGFGGWGGMMGMGMYGLDYLYPWLNNSQHISDGFRDQQLATNINGIQQSITSGFGDVQLGIAGINQNLCQTGNGIINAVNSGFNAAESANNARQIANMQQAFAAQTATQQGFNGVQSQLASCCCENRLATADTKYALATEACATRTANAENTRDIIDSQTRGTQAILDKLCQLELDNYKTQVENKNDTIAQLRSQLQYANMQASQVDQTAQLRASQATTANQLISELRSCPIPAQPVYGSQPIFTCPQQSYSTCGCNTGCGCGVA